MKSRFSIIDCSASPWVLSLAVALFAVCAAIIFASTRYVLLINIDRDHFVDVRGGWASIVTWDTSGPTVFTTNGATSSADSINWQRPRFSAPRVRSRMSLYAPDLGVTSPSMQRINIPLVLPLIAALAFATWFWCGRKRRHIPGRCEACGYALAGLPSVTISCPECGGKITSQTDPAAD
jgi:hypothetical protein